MSFSRKNFRKSLPYPKTHEARKKAYSFLEIAIVILVMGILIAGVTQGRKIIKDSEKVSAQILTETSPLVETSGLLFWIEPVLDRSLGDQLNNAQISNWKDINPQTYDHIILTQSTPSKQPLYIEKAINNLPALQFDGGNDYLEADIEQNPILTPSLTIIAVAQTNSNASAQLVSTKDGGSGFDFGKIGNDKLALKDHGGGSNYNFDHVFDRNPHIIILTYVSEGAQNRATLYVDGKLIGSQTQGSSRDKSVKLFLGDKQGNSHSWDGYIAEIAILNRHLKEEERKQIETYLAKKYAIVLVN
ncbi:MAG: hypothetical protein A2887_00860 [Alphaproteobacteria bacterium RIFCSPLOWO2_01_FULL_40_26]|nr:MAG: hypothetical protein A3D15_02405 [Alphaproteobacteria bacterium RIFCSPHIGHO2_02_FULL_40_34]OFW88062.1 MAG: hypothetical protein A2794_02085 [Alphaproteobacteria bacterium RIFCSPHIGHO2_01_FULL_40_8]OFW95259.1 MAG: hypothetical protein A2887_00860 [Alphaproteobacteria bacterium RIFCSPLOWO2_01_FULL_40_26]OFX09339.1 MAG: hypothetical protein A3H30_06735 [Alphaproteobacteria bacterium RIFCSPLOWO2_02_FULL_40_19]OFX11871.1 MAG: hypothetical protein A3G22_05555 [Alphaproteobacteria bacterium RI